MEGNQNIPEIEPTESQQKILASGSKRDWTSYLKEFLMLFLAVFAGFLAENYRESLNNNQREKDYIKSLIEDLKTDTINLNITIDDAFEKEKDMDILLDIIPRLTEGYDSVIHQKMRSILSYTNFIKADKTMQQLKYSGAMQLIKNQLAVDAITNYDLLNKNLEPYAVSLEMMFQNLRASRYELIDVVDLQRDLKTKTWSELTSTKKKYLLKIDPALFGKFNNQIYGFKNLSILIRKKEENIKVEANKLISILQEEYNL